MAAQVRSKERFRYPAGTDSVSSRRTIAPNRRRVREQAYLNTPPKEGFQRTEIEMHTDRLHVLAEAGEVALDPKGSNIAKIVNALRLGELLEVYGVSIYGSGRTVTDAPGEEKSL